MTSTRIENDNGDIAVILERDREGTPQGFLTATWERKACGVWAELAFIRLREAPLDLTGEVVTAEDVLAGDRVLVLGWRAPEDVTYPGPLTDGWVKINGRQVWYSCPVLRIDLPDTCPHCEGPIGPTNTCHNCDR
jgi:hypothetical protein